LPQGVRLDVLGDEVGVVRIRGVGFFPEERRPARAGFVFASPFGVCYAPLRRDPPGKGIALGGLDARAVRLPGGGWRASAPGILGMVMLLFVR
jgi:hypothetical protein